MRNIGTPDRPVLTQTEVDRLKDGTRVIIQFQREPNTMEAVIGSYEQDGTSRRGKMALTGDGLFIDYLNDCGEFPQVQVVKAPVQQKEAIKRHNPPKRRGRAKKK